MNNSTRSPRRTWARRLLTAGLAARSAAAPTPCASPLNHTETRSSCSSHHPEQPRDSDTSDIRRRGCFPPPGRTFGIARGSSAPWPVRAGAAVSGRSRGSARNHDLRTSATASNSARSLVTAVVSAWPSAGTPALADGSRSNRSARRRARPGCAVAPAARPVRTRRGRRRVVAAR